MPLQRVEDTPPLRARVHAQIQELIVERTFAPGDRLVETELAAKLGVSRGPVREALQQLQREGWIELRPRYGAYVRHPTLKEIEDNFRVRTLLDMEAARLAARNNHPSAVTELHHIVERARAALADGDHATLLELNAGFHRAIAEMTGNSALLEMLSLMEKRIRWFFAPLVGIRAQEVWNEHAALAMAVEHHDEERAVSVTHEHNDAVMVAYREWLIRSYES